MTSISSGRLRSASVSSMRSSELAAVLAGVDPVEQGRARTPDVQVARGRRRESDTDRGGRHPERLVAGRVGHPDAAAGKAVGTH